jgi:hypothetical protein
MRANRTLSAVLTAVLLLGCRATAPAPSADRGPPGGEPIQVVVTNMNWATIEVYALASGQSHWLGMVETGRTETLKLPPRLLSTLDLQLTVQPIGSRTAWTSDALLLSEGMTIELMVENNLALTAYMVYD